MARAAQQNDPLIDREISTSEYFISLQLSLKAVENFPRITGVLILVASVSLAVRALCRRIFRSTIHPDSSGYFSQYIPDEIVVNIESGGKLDGEAVISHEHIHLLQHRDHEVCNRHLSDPRSFLSDAALRFGQFEYFFERREVEARLHEILVCAYRAGNDLPTTLSEFFGLLMRCQHLGAPISVNLGVDPEELDASQIPCRAGGRKCLGSSAWP